jgi:exocyst complex component 4
MLDTLLNEPDPAIIILNNILVSIDTEISTYIPASQLPLISTGLGPLMDIHLLSRSSKISSMNENGAKLMQLNILVLQQNLKNISTDPATSLPYSALYFDLFLAGPDEIVARAKELGKGFGCTGIAKDMFGYDAVKTLIELTYGERLKDERREVGVAAKRELDSHLLEISEALY